MTRGFWSGESASHWVRHSKLNCKKDTGECIASKTLQGLELRYGPFRRRKRRPFVVKAIVLKLTLGVYREALTPDGSHATFVL
jgi:hypothetical protein